MADFYTSSKARKRDEDAIHEMRAGGRRRSRLRRFLLPGLAALVLAAGGGAAYLFVLAPEPGGEPGAAASVPVIAELPTPERRDYVALDPLFVPLRTGQGYRHKIELILMLEVSRDARQDERVRAVLPKLREAYLQALADRPIPGTENGHIELVYIKNRLRAENLRILGPGVVRDVLIRDVRILPS